MTRVVLVRPQGPRNVGSVLRLIANFGPAELVLVRPERPSLLIHPDFTQMSHGVEDAAARIVVVDSVEEALTDCTASYGFTARTRDHRSIADWRRVRAALVDRVRDGEEDVALVFGSEENGLTGAETDPLQELVRIPTTNEHTSLNLAMAVGLVLSTVFLSDAPSAASTSATPITGAARSFLTEHLKDALVARTRSDPAARDLAASIERVFMRAPLETRDARAWHLLARALGSDKKPADYGLVVRPEPRLSAAERESRDGASGSAR